MVGVADFYQGLIDALVVDQLDRDAVAELSDKVEYVLATDTLMFTRPNRSGWRKLSSTFIKLPKRLTTLFQRLPVNLN